MQPFGIVDILNKLSDVVLCLLKRLIRLQVDFLVLQRFEKAFGFGVGLSRQLHRLPLWQKEFSRSPILFIPCAASSLRSSSTGTIGENIGSPFTTPLAT